jgi:opacity protein-like surface antigen
MLRGIRIGRGLVVVCLVTLFGGVGARHASAQGFLSPSFGYNFGGDAGCPSATDCEDRSWNVGGSLGTLGSVFGFEVEFTHENAFTGLRERESTDVLTVMADFLLAPRISIVQPYALAGIGLIRTGVEETIGGSTESESQIGWSVGGGVIVFVHRHVGLKGDIRYYHSFEALNLLGFDLARDENKLDFGRAAFGVVFAF